MRVEVADLEAYEMAVKGFGVAAEVGSVNSLKKRVLGVPEARNAPRRGRIPPERRFEANNPRELTFRSAQTPPPTAMGRNTPSQNVPL